MMYITPDQQHPSKEVDTGLSQSQSQSQTQLNDDLSFEERILRIVLIPILDLLADNRTDINNFVSVNKFFSKNSKLFIKPWPEHCVLNILGKESESYYWSPCLVWSKDMSKIFCTKNPDDGGNKYNYKSIHLFRRENGYCGKIYTLPDKDNYKEIIRVFTLSPCEEMLVVATETERVARSIRILSATEGNNYEQLTEWNILGYDDNWYWSYIEDLAVSPCSKYITMVQVMTDVEGPLDARIIVYGIDGIFIARTRKTTHDINFNRYPRVMFSSDSRAVIFDDGSDSAPFGDCIKVWRLFDNDDDNDDSNDDDGNDERKNGLITTVKTYRFSLGLVFQISNDRTKLLSRVLDNENPKKKFHKYEVCTFADDYKSLKLQKTVPVTKEHNGQYLSTIFTPDGMYALCVPNDMEGGNYNNKKSTILNVENGRTKPSSIVLHDLSKHSFYASFSPDNTRLLTIMNGKIHMLAPIDKRNLP